MRSGTRKFIAPVLPLAVVVFMLFAPKPGLAQTAVNSSIKAGEALTLEKAVHIALALNPDILAAMGTERAAHSLIGQAEASYYPQVSLTASQAEYSLNHNLSSLSGFTALGAVSQDIYDFGKTKSQVNVQKYVFKSSEQDMESIRQNVALQVKQAYFSLLQAQRNIGIAQMVVDQFELHLKQATAFHDAGIKPKYDVTLAQVNLSNAKLNLIVVQNSAAVARANLNNVMGVPGSPEYKVEDNLSFKKYDVSFEGALNRAYANRPDLKSVVFRENSAREAISFVKTGYYPVVSGTASYGYTGDRMPLDSYWTAGVAVSFPIFSGFLTKNQLIHSRENLNVLESNELSLKQSIYLEVQTDYLNLNEAEQRVGAAKLVADQAKENLDVANGMYKYGVGSALDVIDALTTYSSAETSYVTALYDYKTAQAQIEKAMGLYGGGHK